MKNFLIILCTILSGNCFAVIIDGEALLISAKTQGTTVYFSCIVTPPVTPAQQATCLALYTTYAATLTALTLPLPMVMSLDPDPYLWSPYDICRYEAGHIVFGDAVIIPYCPTLPI